MEISLRAARNIHLAAQGLLSPVKKLASKDDVLHAIQQMAALQIDTINVVARSPYLVLWSRLGFYDNAWLDELLAEQKIFEYWSHEACFLPIEHFERYRHQMLHPHDLGWKFNSTWLEKNADQVKKVLQHIAQFGACRSADFGSSESKGSGWWEWKPEKRALEILFTTGKVMVARRQKFQRVYDLTERVLPTWNDERDFITANESQKKQILDAVRALGIAKASWVADYFRMKKSLTMLQTESLFNDGLLQQIKIKEWDEPVYLHPDNTNLLEQALAGELQATHTCLLSPFDPVVWDRKRAAELFNFDYKLECYTPEAKRQYGYFTLPILRRGSLIGRIDAKAHRKLDTFEIKGIFLEDEIKVSEHLISDLTTTIQKFATWHGTSTIALKHCNNANMHSKLSKAFEVN
jgi:uncharacterized protein YcaQ